MRSMNALKAYKKSTSHRSIREQEADVFRQVNLKLMGCNADCAMSKAKAVADNKLLWVAIMDIVRDPANQLDLPTKASIISLGHAARREMEAGEPDFSFLIGLNEQIAAGLTGG